MYLAQGHNPVRAVVNLPYNNSLAKADNTINDNDDQSIMTNQ